MALKGFTPGTARRPIGAAAKAKTATVLEKIAKAEAELASIAEAPGGLDVAANTNAKWNLARLREQRLALDSNDSEYWFCVCFESREQKEDFLQRFPGLLKVGDKYIDGREMARAFGFVLASDKRAFHTLPVNLRWKRFALPVQPAPEGLEK